MDRNQICVLFSTFMCQFYFGSLLYGMTGMLVAIIETFNTSRAEAALVPAVYTALLSCIGIPAGEIVQRFGAKTAGAVGSIIVGLAFSVCYFATSLIYLVIAIGVFAGSGMSLIYISCSSIICNNFFGKSRLTALSFMIVGSSFGGMSSPYLVEYFLTGYGLRGTCLLLGGITLNSVVMVMLWNKSTETKTNTAHTDTSVEHHTNNSDVTRIPAPKNNLKHVFTDKTFSLFAFGNAVKMAAMNNVVAFVVDIMLDKYDNRSLGSLAIFIFTLSSLFGRLLPGLLKHIPRLSTLDIPLFSTVFGLCGCLLMPFVGSVIVSLISWSLLGIDAGVTISAVSVTTAKLLGKYYIATGMGVILTLTGIGTLVGAPLNGYIRDAAGNYQSVFFSTTALLLGAVILISAAKWFRQTKKSPNCSRVPSSERSYD